MTTPLAGLRIVEFEAVGPVPHAVALLTGLGAEVVRVRRPVTNSPRDPSPFAGRTVEVDLTDPQGVADVLALIDRADVLLDGYRPGVLERRGIGPDVTLARNPALIFARMTGWGQTGPRAPRAGHDLNYLSITGALDLIGTADGPIPPINFVGDYGGGSMLLVIGILAALHERSRSGRGQVVDAAIVDGVATMMTPLVTAMETGGWRPGRAANVLDGGAPYYRTYRCADDRFVAVGAIEDPFYLLLVQGLGLDPTDLPDRHDRSRWPVLTALLAERFAVRDRDAWAELFADVDACVTPVLSPLEAVHDEHLRARGVFAGDREEVAAAPRFSRSHTEPLGGGGVATPTELTDIIELWRT